MDYGNYYPKKIKNFSKKGDPVIISVKFGLYHEAYLDTEGRIHLCPKYELPSKKLITQDDCKREDMQVLEVEGEQIIQVEFTKNRIFALTSSGKVYLFIVSKQETNGESLEVEVETDKIFEQIVSSLLDEIYFVDPNPFQIQELENITSIKTGEDHFLGLNSDGEVYAMGDDKFGQCGQYHDNRPVLEPFKEVRLGKPQKVNIKDKITKIACGYRHSLAISHYGRLYGWGYNQQIQLSHGDNMASESSQKFVVYEPCVITKEIDSHRVTDVDGGMDFSIIVTEDGRGDQYFWGTGNNLRGQLGINMTTHFHDITPMFFDDEPIEPVKFEFLS